MRDETPDPDLTRDTLSNKSFHRNARLVAPKAARKSEVVFDDATSERLLRMLRPTARQAALRPSFIDESIVKRLEIIASVGTERNEAALALMPEILVFYLGQKAWGSDKFLAMREKTRRDLRRFKRLLIRYGKHSPAGLPALLSAMQPEHELEARLLQAGWPRDWAMDRVPKFSDSLCAVVERALERLETETRDDGGPVRQWAEREAGFSLATVWWWTTRRPITFWRERNGTRRYPFADFLEEAIAIAEAAAPKSKSKSAASETREKPQQRFSGRHILRMLADIA